MGNNILIKNGLIVTPEQVLQADLLVSGELIAAIDPKIDDVGADIIDATGCYVLPGGVDVHTHFNLDVGVAVAQDDFYTGTVAAAMGGTTTIVDHPGFGPKGCSLMHQIDKYHEYARDKAVIDYSFHGVFQHFDADIAAQIPQLIEAGISSAKVYMTYDHKFTDEMLLELFTVAKEQQLLITVHAEDDLLIQKLKREFISASKTEPIYHAKSRPVQAEASAVSSVIKTAAKAGGAPLYIVHLSSKDGLKLIEESQSEDQWVFAETCPQYLLLGEDRYLLSGNEGLKYVMSPPLRSREHQDALWEGLAKGSIQVVATDHCPFDFVLKQQLGAEDFSKCPGGAPGVESRLALLFSEGVQKKRLTIDQFVRVTAENPAKIMGLYPQKGQLAVGADADIVIFDPEKNVTLAHDMLHENVDYSTYEDFELSGWPILTMVRGSIVVRDGVFIGSQGFGKFIKRRLLNE